jgi:HAMP domain-containing protein
MRLLLKFSAIFAVVFGAGAATVCWFSYRLLEQGARAEVLGQARLMMEATRSVRDYTNLQLKSLLLTVETRDDVFLPQTVPAFAATENIKYLRRTFPDYDYKEAALNPSNPRDRAVDWEADIINAFRNSAGLTLLSGERAAATGPSLYLAQPIRADAPCLQCHSVPSAAPQAMVALYGSDNGFGWKQGEVVGAQIISVPMSVALQLADQDFRSLLESLLIVFLISLVVLNIALYTLIARPAARLSQMANRISLGDLETPELPVTGKDEVADLAEAFNRMRRSLVTAMKMLEDQQ